MTERTFAESPAPFVICAKGARIVADPGACARGFTDSKAIALANIFAPEFLEAIMAICGGAQFVDNAHDRGRRLWERPGIASGMIALAINRPELLDWLRIATGCPAIQSGYGHVLETVNRVDRSRWHDDLDTDPSRLIAITINLTDQPHDGGLFRLRTSAGLVFEHRHRAIGSALIFAVSGSLQHSVTPVLTGGPRRMFVGWFVDRPWART